MMGLRFSVIITTFNRPASLARALAALARSNYPRDEFEVIVVDDGGSEPLERVVTGVETSMDVRLIRQPENRGPAQGRNRGADAASNEFLAFSDDDCEPRPEWLSALARRLLESPESLVGGRTVNGLPQNTFSAASQLVVDMVYAAYNADPANAQFFATNNLAVRADLFRRCGAFDDRFRISEDREFCNRWRHRGFLMSYQPDAIVEHRHPLDLRAFWRQHFSYGQGAAHFHRTCAERNSGRLRDHFGFYGKLPGAWKEGCREISRWESLRMIPVLALWQAANAAGFFYESCRNRMERRPQPASHSTAGHE